MGKYDIITVNKYDFYECSSALQKSIRRGLEDEALFWAVELFDSNFGEYVWKRLRIMTSEDIGLAEPNMPANIWALYSMHVAQAKHKDDKNKPERLFLTQAVIMLCRAKKSRLIDWALIWAWTRHNFMLRRIPDFALDKHNDRGRKLGRSWKHFFEEGTLLNNHADIYRENEFKDLAHEALANPSGVSLFD